MKAPEWLGYMLTDCLWLQTLTRLRCRWNTPWLGITRSISPMTVRHAEYLPHSPQLVPLIHMRFMFDVQGWITWRWRRSTTNTQRFRLRTRSVRNHLMSMSQIGVRCCSTVDPTEERLLILYVCCTLYWYQCRVHSLLTLIHEWQINVID